jgi:dTDP-glucose 4,6-dehydratase
MGSRQQTCELIPSIVNYVLNYSGKDILIEDPVVREWAHVDDVISGIMKVLENAPAGEIYNLSSGAEISNLDLANKIVNIIGLPGNVVPTVGKQHYRYSCDSSKLKSLGWQPNFKFHKALESTVNWYTANRWWFRG